MRYLKKHADFDTTLARLTQIGRGLRALHHASIGPIAIAHPTDIQANYVALKEATTAPLDSINSAYTASVAALFDTFLAQLKQFLEDAFTEKPSPIHGAFGWHAIRYENEHLYFWGFEQCHLAHPGWDVGNFLADLVNYYLLHPKPRTAQYPTARAAFWDGYCRGHSPCWGDALDLFVAGGLLTRLQQLVQTADEIPASQLARWLDICQQFLQRAAASDASSASASWSGATH